MKTNKNASLEARLKNTKDLVISVKEYQQYAPTSTDIRVENFEQFVDTVTGKMEPYTLALGELEKAERKNNTQFNTLTKKVRDILSEIGETKGKSSEEYRSVRTYVNLITGQNIRLHSENRKQLLKNLKEGDPKPETISVSALDYKSKLGNFRFY